MRKSQWVSVFLLKLVLVFFSLCETKMKLFVYCVRKKGFRSNNVRFPGTRSFLLGQGKHKTQNILNLNECFRKLLLAFFVLVKSEFFFMRIEKVPLAGNCQFRSMSILSRVCISILFSVQEEETKEMKFPFSRIHCYAAFNSIVSWY